MSAPTLNRSLGLRLVIVIVIGNIIGSGVYKKVAPMAAELHSSGWVLVCWILAGIITNNNNNDQPQTKRAVKDACTHKQCLQKKLNIVKY